MNLLKLVFITLVVINLTGCAGTRNIIVEPIQPLALGIPRLQSLDMQSFEWSVITPETSSNWFGELDKEEKDAVGFCLTDEGYQALSINFLKLRKHIELQNTVIDIYKDYYEADKE